MSEKPIAIASDHAGYDLKSTLAEQLATLGHEVLDLGTNGRSEEHTSELQSH
jgi:ribose 5-phosphate isomerase B